MSVGSDVGYAVGVAGVVLAITRYWIDQRRARPIVICHEDHKRTLREGRFVAEAHITNESAASAFNIRFGVRVGDVYVPWTHSHEDDEPSRINVLRPNGRHPEKVPIGIVIPDDVVVAVARDRDPDEGRSYWAYYQGPAGDWWYTRNPSIRSEDFKITRVRSKRFAPISPRNRRLDKALRLGVSFEVGFAGVKVSLDSRSEDSPPVDTKPRGQT